MSVQMMKVTNPADIRIVHTHHFGAKHHHQCAWCWRLTHVDNRPHGHPLPKLQEYSHGICVQCKARLLARQDLQHVRVVIFASAAMAGSPSAA